MDDQNPYEPRWRHVYSPAGLEGWEEPRPQPPRRRVVLPILLFLATIGTTMYAGMGLNPRAEQYLRNPSSMEDAGFFRLMFELGWPYSAAVMLILFSHEMGHFITAMRYGVRASLPYFIPFPANFAGTFGAVIVMRERIRRKSQVFDIGIAGPIAGFVVLVPLMIWGVYLSPVQVMGPGTHYLEGDSILYWLIKTLIHGEIPDGSDIRTHPIAFAAWIGGLVTALNMMPVGQLDGGHVTYSMFGPRTHARIGHRLVQIMTVVGVIGLVASFAPSFGWEPPEFMTNMSGWIIWAIMLRFMGRAHPPVDDEWSELDPMRRRVGAAGLLMFVLTFVPVPLTIVTIPGEENSRPPAGKPTESVRAPAYPGHEG
ncbi:MAG: hypothetical protein GMKNLPBB_01050 [Myxococcota bacterium]|nr:hypothetical protein [Myxococcota bacterium]